MSDMKTLTMRDLNRKTATVLDAVGRGEVFELRRNGKAIGYITHTPPAPPGKPDWKVHFKSAPSSRRQSSDCRGPGRCPKKPRSTSPFSLSYPDN
jgi:antitoxin (DNA-binding transcriptional repressor) of toxin-antitoxin stability system